MSKDIVRKPYGQYLYEAYAEIVIEGGSPIETWKELEPFEKEIWTILAFRTDFEPNDNMLRGLPWKKD